MNSHEMPADIHVSDSIPYRFFTRAARHPLRTALVGEGFELSYGELAAQARSIGAALHRQQVRPGDRVGLLAPRSPEAIAAILGILAAGAAYVPLDPGYPPKLLDHLCSDAAPSMLLAQSQLLGKARTVWNGPVLDLEQCLAAPADWTLRTPPAPQDLAYVMYTSGSTGRPKGVMIPHRAVLRLVIGNHFATLDSEQTILQLAPLSFDASTFEIWGALLNGGRLAFASSPQPSLEDIGAAIARHGVTTLWLTAGLFHLMVDHRLEALKPLRQLLAGGDVLSPSHVGRTLRALPGCRLINGYGPTENTTFSCCYTIPHEAFDGGAIPIGTAIAQTSVHILDERMQPVAAGADGELYLGGAGLADGYLNRPDLTEERFVADPFDRRRGTRLYRTGDRVRQRPDGNLEFLGRVDRQVKINGKRVELDEVEACLRRCPQVADAAAVCFESPAGRRIAAFAATAAGGAATPDRLRDFLRQELPDYMVPASIRLLDRLPLSPTGKIDRAALPLPSDPPATVGGDSAAAGTMEATVARVWREVLGTATVGPDDNFFDIGGTSLQLLKAHALLQAALGERLPVIDLFTYPTIRTLAARLGGAASSDAGGRERGRRFGAALSRLRARESEFQR